jgi:hypothetical protein
MITYGELCDKAPFSIKKIKKLTRRLWYKITGRRVPFRVVIDDAVLFNKALLNSNTLKADDIVSVQPFTQIHGVLNFEYRNDK